MYEYLKLKELIEKYNNGIPLLYLYENVLSMRNDIKTEISK